MDTRTDGHTLTDKPQTNATVALMHLAELPYQHSTLRVAGNPLPLGAPGPLTACEGRDGLCPGTGGRKGCEGSSPPSSMAQGRARDPAGTQPFTGNGLMWGTTTQRPTGLAASSRGNTHWAGCKAKLCQSSLLQHPAVPEHPLKLPSTFSHLL